MRVTLERCHEIHHGGQRERAMKFAAETRQAVISFCDCALRHLRWHSTVIGQGSRHLVMIELRVVTLRYIQHDAPQPQLVRRVVLDVRFSAE